MKKILIIIGVLILLWVTGVIPWQIKVGVKSIMGIAFFSLFIFIIWRLRRWLRKRKNPSG